MRDYVKQSLLVSAFVLLAGQALAQDGSNAGPANGADASVIGAIPLAINVTETMQAVKGWSVSRQIMGQPVYNEKAEKIGNVADLIISPSNSVAYAVVGVGGFLGLAQNDVLVPVSLFKVELGDGRIILPGATKEALKQLPPFQYTR